ncbi:MAG: metal ABC transporter ATP-binding protein [Anaerolineae bacterium]
MGFVDTARERIDSLMGFNGNGLASGSPPPAVRARHVTVRRGDLTVLEDIDFTVPAGQMVAVIGPNGAGKSTLFNALVGLMPITSGDVELLGRPSRERGAADVSYVAQRDEIDWRFPVRVEDVVLMGRYPHVGWVRRPSAADREKARAALGRVGLADVANRQIGQLSGGQQQRVFLARALAQEARLLLLDEPFTGLDAVAEAMIFDILAELQREGRAILVATHDLNMVMHHFETAIALNRRIFGYGPVQDVLCSEILTETYGGQLTMLRGTDGRVVVLGDGCGHFG